MATYDEQKRQTLASEPGLQYLFCDDKLIFACNDQGYVYIANTEDWAAWLDLPLHADQEPFAIERFALPHAFEDWDTLGWQPARFEAGHLHIKDLRQPGTPGLSADQIAGITYKIRARGLISEDQKTELVDALVEYSAEAIAGLIYEPHHYNQPVEDMVRESLARRAADDLEDDQTPTRRCPSCDGGSVTWTITCPICDSSGKVTQTVYDEFVKRNRPTANKPDWKTWYIVLAIEHGPDGRELAINKPDDLSGAITIAKRYDSSDHGYEKIVVRRQPDKKVVWDSTDDERPTAKQADQAAEKAAADFRRRQEENDPDNPYPIDDEPGW